MRCGFFAGFRCLALVLLAFGLQNVSWAQRLRLVSEFQRFSPSGEIVIADRSSRAPRELISPAVARNAFTTYRIVVALPDETRYSLHIAQNPENLLKATLYQETYAKQGEAWMPAGLQELPLSVGAKLHEQTVQTYLLDVWVPMETPPQRIRVEVQLNVADEWTILPLEMRITSAVVPAAGEEWSSLRAYACGAKPAEHLKKAELTVQGLSARNARQDAALAQIKAKTETAPVVALALAHAAGFDSRDTFCAAHHSPLGPDWILRARDYLIQGRTPK